MNLKISGRTNPIITVSYYCISKTKPKDIVVDLKRIAFKNTVTIHAMEFGKSIYTREKD